MDGVWYTFDQHSQDGEKHLGINMDVMRDQDIKG